MRTPSEEDARAPLDLLAKRVRALALKSIAKAGSGHPGGSLSCTDILVALYWRVLAHDPADPAWEGRDLFVLSKGHAAPALYAVLALRGYFPVEELATLRGVSSRLQGHPCRLETPGVEVSTGSLGQGVSQAVGLALGVRGTGRSVFVLAGDGEMQEGQVWEALLSASHYGLGNLTVIVDRNDMQIEGTTAKVMSLEPLAAKFRAFGFDTAEVDGHDHGAVVEALKRGPADERPRALVAKTVKGKGVSFMENNVSWHGVAPDEEQLALALAEIGET